MQPDSVIISTPNLPYQPSPLHRAVDHITAASLELQMLGLKLSKSTEIRREHFDAVARIEDRLLEVVRMIPTLDLGGTLELERLP